MKYEIKGDSLPVVICQLEAGEQMLTEGGGMSWMSPNMQMETTSNGGVGKALGRMFAGEKLFQNIYTAQGGPGMKNKFLGGEGLFNTVITGPGHVWLQTMPLSNVAGVLRAYLPTSN